MEWLSLLWLLPLIAIILVLLRFPKFIYISIVTLPRDVYGLYKYLTMTVFCFYCKYSNLTVSRYFDRTASKRRMQACFCFEDEIWTFKRVQEESFKIAKYFQNEGYKKGDVVGLFMENRPEYVCVWLGLSRLGVVTSLLNYNVRLNSLTHCVNSSKCKGLIFGTELTNAIEEVSNDDGFKDIKLYSLEDRTPPEKMLSSSHVNLNEELKSIDKTGLDQEDFGAVNNHDIALHIFTSGTTGLPKAVLMTHSRLFSYASVFFPAGMNPDKDILLTPIPLYHVQGGILGVTCALIHGVPQVIIRKFSASNFWKQCIQYDATYCQYLGEIIRYLYNQPERPEDKMHKVHTFYGNGVNPAIWEKFVTRFNNVNIKEMYGSTEGNCNTMNVEAHVGAAGYLPIWLYPLMPVFIGKVDSVTGELIRDSHTGLVKHVKVNEPGEVMSTISMRNPLREFNGYTDKEATEKKMAHDVKRKGDVWYRSGDMLEMDEYGYLYFRDRSGDTFRWKGENVSTAEVEEIVVKGSGYKSVAVYGVEIPGTEGRCGMAAISDPEGTIDLTKLANAVIRYLPAYARPIFIRIYSTELQMTGTFKLTKKELQKDGFHLENIREPVFVMKGDKYVPLDSMLYGDIVTGKMRL